MKAILSTRKRQIVKRMTPASDPEDQRLQNALIHASPVEEARIFERLLQTTDTQNQRDLARRMGVSQARISQRLALLQMPREIVELMSRPKNALTERHARTLRRLPDAKLQVWLAKRIAKDGLTVDESNEIVTAMLVDLGVVLKHHRSAWSHAPDLQWKDGVGGLELKVRGRTRADRLKALKRFFAMYSRESRG